MRNNKLACCRLLLRMGVDRGLQNADGKKASELQAVENSPEMKHLLSIPPPATPKVLQCIPGYGCVTVVWSCPTELLRKDDGTPKDPNSSLVTGFRIYAIPQGVTVYAFVTTVLLACLLATGDPDVDPLAAMVQAGSISTEERGGDVVDTAPCYRMRVSKLTNECMYCFAVQGSKSLHFKQLVLLIGFMVSQLSRK